MRLFVIALFLCFQTRGRGHILDKIPLIDGHNDLAYNIYLLNQNNLTAFEFEKDLRNDPLWGRQNCGTCFTDLPRLKAGKVSAQFWSAAAHCDTQYKDVVAKTVEQVDVIKRLVKRYPNDLQFATSVKDIRNAIENKRIASMIGVEGGHSVDSRLSVLRMLYEIGVRYMTMAHICNTPWVDNYLVDDSTPVHNLTDFGKLVVKEMNRLGMLVDLSHVSHNVMIQALEVTRSPVMFSHSSAYTIRKHSRNVQDHVLELVKANGGVVMVNFLAELISETPEKATLHDIVKHINHIVNVAGHQSVGIGSDFDGLDGMPKGMDDVSNFPDLFDLLISQNASRWTEDNLKLLAGENLLRVFENVEKVRDSLANEEPYQDWIPIEDLNAVDDKTLWRCRTLVNNTSPEEKA